VDQRPALKNLSTPDLTIIRRAHPNEIPPGAGPSRSMETGREVDEIRMKLVGGGITVSENLIDLDQSSVDMPPPPMIAPLKRLEQLLGESALPLISYAQFNESCDQYV
jgi:hypothetical protein